jgi:hypothetical protein
MNNDVVSQATRTVKQLREGVLINNNTATDRQKMASKLWLLASN